MGENVAVAAAVIESAHPLARPSLSECVRPPAAPPRRRAHRGGISPSVSDVARCAPGRQREKERESARRDGDWRAGDSLSQLLLMGWTERAEDCMMFGESYRI